MIDIQGEFFYLKASKYPKKYVWYEKNFRNKNFILEREKRLRKNSPHTRHPRNLYFLLQIKILH